MKKQFGLLLVFVASASLMITGCSGSPKVENITDPSASATNTAKSSQTQTANTSVTPNPSETASGNPVDPSGSAGQDPNSAGQTPGSTAAPDDQQPKNPRPTPVRRTQEPGKPPPPPTPTLAIGAIPENGKPPKVTPPLESHPSDAQYFVVNSDDYIVWANKPKRLATADWEYYVVSFNKDGMQTAAFMKYVFPDVDSAKFFASSNQALIQVANVVYYTSWMGTQAQTKEGILELTNSSDINRYVSKP